jgi:FtsH-binding integral membrane protein
VLGWTKTTSNSFVERQSTPRIEDDNDGSERSQFRHFVAFYLAFSLTAVTLLLASFVVYAAQSTRYNPSSLIFVCLFCGSAISVLIIPSPIPSEHRSARFWGVEAQVCGKAIAHFNGVAFLAHSVFLTIGFYPQWDMDEGGEVTDLARSQWMTLILISVLMVAFSTGVILIRHQRPGTKISSWYERREKILCGDARSIAAHSITRVGY